MLPVIAIYILINNLFVFVFFAAILPCVSFSYVRNGAEKRKDIKKPDGSSAQIVCRIVGSCQADVMEVIASPAR